MHKFTSNIPIIVNNISTIQDVSAQNMDLSGSLDVSQNTTIGGDLNVTGVITGDVTGNVTGNVTGSVTGNAGTVTTGVYTAGTQTIGGVKTFSDTIIGNVTGNVTGNAGTVTNGVYTSGDQTIGGFKTFSSTITGNVTGNAGTVTNGVYTSGNQTIGGNVGIGGASGTEKLLVTGSERITGNLHVGGDFIVDGAFNFNEIIQNITTVNNEVIISTQLDISNQGTGPALKVSQFGVGEDQDVAVFNAGDEGDAFKIDYAGNSHFYKPVNMNNTLLIRNGWNVPRMLSGYQAGGAEIGTVTFSKTFDSAPSVVASINRDKPGFIYVIHIYNITTTNFSYGKRFFNGGSIGAGINESFHWIAMEI